MNHKERMSHPSDPKLTATALNLRKGRANIQKYPNHKRNGEKKKRKKYEIIIS